MNIFDWLILSTLALCAVAVRRRAAARERIPHRRACGWCRKELSPGREPTTHGICPTCYETELAQAEALRAMGEAMGIPGEPFKPDPSTTRREPRPTF